LSHEWGKNCKLRNIRTTSNDVELVRQRRNMIAEGALKLFLEKGYERTTMREIGKACGMTHGNLYNYVGSKKDIRHLILMRDIEGDTRLKNFRRKLGNASYVKVLGECIAEFLRGMDRMTEPLLFFDREVYKFSREERRIALDAEVAIVYFFEDLIREGIEAEEFQVCNPILLAHDILMYGHDWAVRRWFLKQHVTLEEYTKEHVRLVLELVTTKTNQTNETSFPQ